MLIIECQRKQVQKCMEDALIFIVFLVMRESCWFFQSDVKCILNACALAVYSVHSQKK